MYNLCTMTNFINVSTDTNVCFINGGVRDVWDVSLAYWLWQSFKVENKMLITSHWMSISATKLIKKKKNQH